jgi:hypothetical protein
MQRINITGTANYFVVGKNDYWYYSKDGERKQVPLSLGMVLDVWFYDTESGGVSNINVEQEIPDSAEYILISAWLEGKEL